MNTDLDISKRKRIVWKVQSLSSSTASTRYRCLIPVRHLKANGYRCEVYGDADLVDLSDDPLAIIFVKSFSANDLKYARFAHSQRIPIILDLCDNILYKADNPAPGDDIPALIEMKENFVSMAKIASAIVTTGPELARAIKEYIGETNVKISIIPDAAETPTDRRFASSFRRKEQFRLIFSKGIFWFLAAVLPRLSLLAARLVIVAWDRKIEATAALTGRMYRSMMLSFSRLISPISRRARYFHSITRQLKADNAKHPKSNSASLPQLLWFGNAGQSFVFGISDLAIVSEALQKVYKRSPFQLTVVSNSHRDFQKYVANLPFPTRYCEWTPAGVEFELQRSAVVLVPNRQNPFSICKSANRAVLALDAGVPVVATYTAALEPFKDCIMTDDWQNGVETYLSDSSRRQRDIRQAKDIIEKEFSGARIAEKWARTLEEL